MTDLSQFLASYRKGMLANATDYLVTPTFSSRQAVLVYKAGKLVTNVPDDVVRRSRLRRDLFEGLARVPTAFSCRTLTIVGHRVLYRDKTFFIAEEMFSGPGMDQLNATLPLQLHFLTERKFLTVKPLMSWLSVVGVSSSGSPKVQDLPKSKHEAKVVYSKRLKALQEVLTYTRPSYWHPSTKVPGTGRVLPVPEITGLRIAYAACKAGKLVKFPLTEHAL